jgi:hypothetical protein
MPGHLLALLHVEERQLLAELRASPSFQKLEAVRRVIAVYASGGGAEDGQVAELLLGAHGADHPPAAKDAPATPGQAAVAAVAAVESVASAPWHAAPPAATMAAPVEAPAPEPAAMPRVAAEASRGAAAILATAAAANAERAPPRRRPTRCATAARRSRPSGPRCSPPSRADRRTAPRLLPGWRRSGKWTGMQGMSWAAGGAARRRGRHAGRHAGEGRRGNPPGHLRAAVIRVTSQGRAMRPNPPRALPPTARCRDGLRGGSPPRAGCDRRAVPASDRSRRNPRPVAPGRVLWSVVTLPRGDPSPAGATDRERTA